jgi:hypothetical protein
MGAGAPRRSLKNSSYTSTKTSVTAVPFSRLWRSLEFPSRATLIIFHVEPRTTHGCRWSETKAGSCSQPTSEYGTTSWRSGRSKRIPFVSLSSLLATCQGKRWPRHSKSLFPKCGGYAAISSRSSQPSRERVKFTCAGLRKRNQNRYAIVDSLRASKRLSLFNSGGPNRETQPWRPR